MNCKLLQDSNDKEDGSDSDEERVPITRKFSFNGKNFIIMGNF